MFQHLTHYYAVAVQISFLFFLIPTISSKQVLLKLSNFQSPSSGRTLPKTNIKHYKRLCRFELDIVSATVESVGEYFSRKHFPLYQKQCRFGLNIVSATVESAGEYFSRKHFPLYQKQCRFQLDMFPGTVGSAVESYSTQDC